MSRRLEKRSSREWRCSSCRKLLGVLTDARLHVRFVRGHEYMVGLPVTGVCRGCGTLNELSIERPAARLPDTSQP